MVIRRKALTCEITGIHQQVDLASLQRPERIPRHNQTFIRPYYWIIRLDCVTPCPCSVAFANCLVHECPHSCSRPRLRSHRSAFLRGSWTRHGRRLATNLTFPSQSFLNPLSCCKSGSTCLFEALYLAHKTNLRPTRRFCELTASPP